MPKSFRVTKLPATVAQRRAVAMNAAPPREAGDYTSSWLQSTISGRKLARKFGGGRYPIIGRAFEKGEIPNVAVKDGDAPEVIR